MIDNDVLAAPVSRRGADVAVPAPVRAGTDAAVRIHRRTAGLRRILGRFAEVGRPAAGHELQPLLGPTGSVVWTSPRW
ncbi:hypothetical protein [Actinopolymorpha rutila]|uniref:Uncharacterized protein n=1 Tax=Actinopolymorpha rutila TaxID=446787 RepID=A0A852ZVJ1_9ACTN|nr:hypothetical protein [Actinopolymorpha rutila]NYH93339.1 hypothetical protein [Actinopolymorpha rutila]